MSAPQRVSGQEIREALDATQGNIAAAARRLGIASNNLRKRLDGLGVNVATLRAAASARRDRSRSVRIADETFERLRSAKFDLQHRLRRELTEPDVLEMLICETFDGWLSARLGGER